MHTVVIGTSKSKNEFGYYINSKKKFWGLIYQSGLTPRLLEPNEFQILTDQYGIGFSELAYHHIFLGESDKNDALPNDEMLNDQLTIINEGIPGLIQFLKTRKPKRIVFNGKAAAAAFYQFMNHGKVEKVSAAYVNELGYKFGKINTWNEIEVWMLPNLSNAAGNSWISDEGEKNWFQFWEMIAKENPAVSKKNYWVYLIILLVLISLFVIFKIKSK
jgi:G:T/U-mismatch repair DNA glycosylase